MLNADSSFLLLEEGRKTEAEEVSTHVGGGAVNVAVAMARLGMDVAVLAKLGSDERADTNPRDVPGWVASYPRLLEDCVVASAIATPLHQRTR